MTRKEELGTKARQFMETQDRYPYLTAIDLLYKELLQVEREVFRKVVDKIELEMEKENESTDDQIWEIRDWCKAQQQELNK